MKKLFSLIEEYDSYGEGNTRIRMTTAYAKATGAYKSNSSGYGGSVGYNNDVFNTDGVLCRLCQFPHSKIAWRQAACTGG